MSPSSKFVMRRGRHGNPRVCHPPPPPPPIIIIPPPTCPPTQIGGWIDATFGWGEPYDSYYSAYTAPQQEEPPLRYIHTNYPADSYHHITIDLTDGGPTLDIYLEIYFEGGEGMWWNRWGFPFTWCTSNNITCSEWDDVPDEHVSCSVNLQW